MLYFSTFISGIQNFISKIIQNYINDIEVLKILDGGILYKTNKTFQEIENIRFFNNTFFVFHYLENFDGTIENYIEKLDFNKIFNCDFLQNFLKKNKNFKIFSSVENELISVNKKALSKLENEIKKQYKINVNFDKRPSDYEFWILSRSEKITFFMLRITKNRKKCEKGELKPEISNILNLIAGIDENDVILDPFCGSGSILLERSRIADFKGLFNCDIDKEKVLALKDKIKKINNKKLNKSFFVKNLDFFENNFDNNFFTKIITDPPWGFFEKVDNIDAFYSKFFEISYRILKESGILVLLTANKNEVESLLNKSLNKFQLQEKYDILISGKKAGIYKIVIKK